MPLIVLTGLPSSGKSQRAKQLEQQLQDRLASELLSKSIKSKRIHVLTESIQKEAYKDANAEKKARGTLISAVNRHLSRDDIVIVDGLNYIKGFRYQLFCIAKALGTPHCVVQTVVPLDIIKEWNRQRDDGNPYPEDIMDDLISRYEEPEERNRWDSPLFALTYDDNKIPIDNIWDAVILRKPPPPNLSTVSTPVSTTNYVYELDKITLEIINVVMKTRREYGEGGPMIEVPHTEKKLVNPSRRLTLPELRRIRKQFIDLNKLRPPLEIDQIAEMFVDYLEESLRE